MSHVSWKLSLIFEFKILNTLLKILYQQLSSFSQAFFVHGSTISSAFFVLVLQLICFWRGKAYIRLQAPVMNDKSKRRAPALSEQAVNKCCGKKDFAPE